jgi:Tfp pilus assembly protein PilX
VSRRLARQDGSAVVTAMLVTVIMMMLGLVTYAGVDVQTHQSAVERNRESSFNLSEGGLQQQGYVLGHNWPATASTAYGDCTFTATAANTPAGTCPQPPNLADATGTGSFTQADYREGVQWKTTVRDNPGLTENYTAAVLTAPSYDANGDNKLWVRASATVRGRTRSLVALLKRARFTEPFPRNAVTAGSLAITNSGNKTFIDATGSQVVVRCTASGSACVDQPRDVQIEPNAVVREPATPPAMSAAQIERFKRAAQTASVPRYFDSCPSAAQLTGPVVFIDLPPGTGCSYNNVTVNAEGAPGIIVMPRGTLSFKGIMYGLLYLANQQGSSGDVLTLQAGSEVIGGVSVDGAGRLLVGAASGNRKTITYDPGAFNSLQTFGTAGLVQNTWRELPPQS